MWYDYQVWQPSLGKAEETRGGRLSGIDSTKSSKKSRESVCPEKKKAYAEKEKICLEKIEKACIKKEKARAKKDKSQAQKEESKSKNKGKKTVRVFNHSNIKIFYFITNNSFISP